MSEQFDLFEGLRQKEKGMALAADNRAGHLSIARSIAVRLAAQSPSRTVCADDVQRELIELGIDLGPAAGSIFRGREWAWDGQWKKSARVSNHARMLRVWRLK